MISITELQRLIKNCNELLFFTETFCDEEDMPKYREQIMHALRKIVIANEVADRYIIAVTGLQGVGKTTLMKNYYNLDDSIMNIAIGRGERLPVFLTEDNAVDKPILYVYGFEKQKNQEYVIKAREVSSQEFVEASKSEDEEKKIIYLEIKIPMQHKNARKYSFMLLPGYEPKNGKKDYWNTLIEFSVNCSDTAIYVSSQSAIANQQNEDFKNMISAISSNRCIYAISFSDTVSDNNKEAKQTLMNIANIKEAEADRVICTGVYESEEQNSEWKKQLNTAINKYSADMFDVGQNGGDYLRSVINDEIKPVLNSIEKIIKNNTKQLAAALENSKWIEYFEKRKNDIRKNYKSKLNSSFKSAFQEDKEKLIQVLKDENFFQHLKTLVFDSPAQTMCNMQAIMDKAMRDNAGNYRYKKAFVNAVSSCTDALCIKPSQKSLESGESPKMEIWKMAQKLEIEDKKEDNEKCQVILKDIDTILSQREKDNQLQIIETKDLYSLMKVTADCAAQYFGLRVVSDLYSCEETSKYFDVGIMEQSGLDISEIGKDVRSMQAFGLSILGITGLDLVGDGEINLISSLGESLGVAEPVAAGFVVALGLAGAAQAIIRDCHKIEITKLNTCVGAIHEVYLELESRYLELYDEYMDSVKEKICAYLRHSKGIDADLINRQNAETKLTAIKNNIANIIKELGSGKNGLLEFAQK